MTDIRLHQIVEDLPTLAVTFDWLMTPLGALDTRDELATSVIVALGTDRLAEPEDELPGFGEADRRGWWGDTEAEVIWDGWRIGSRLWLMARHKITGPAARQGASTARAREYALEALQPFIDKGVASAVDVTAARVGLDRIDVETVLYRGPEPALALRWSSVWDEIRDAALQPSATAPPAPLFPSGPAPTALAYELVGVPLNGA